MKPRGRLGIVIALLASLHLLLFYGLPASVLVAVLAVLAVVYFRSGAVAATAITLSLALATGLGAVAIHLLGLDRAMYYRPHEQLAMQDYGKGHRAYRPNTEIRMQVPHGDLQALTGASLAQPREVLFRTDCEGFRNDADYRAGEPVLLGDSFVVGMADSQQDTLSAQLAARHGIHAYNLGQPGDVADYLIYYRAFRQRHPEAGPAALFLFEGNDFPEGKYEDAAARTLGPASRWLGRYYGLFTDTAFYRVTKSLWKRASFSSDIAASSHVRIETVAGQAMGLYTPYVEVTQRSDYAMPDAMRQDLIELGRQMAAIYFIPSNYRVYAQPLGVAALPNAQWQSLSKLCAEQGWRCIDLSPALAEAATRGLERGEFVWWRDDTHWNRAGIAVAARVVAQTLGQGAAK
ncbi:MAG: hypothetical protein HY850_04645 [Betaproteobacteria bacterium]|nr:hypothetical protein [Betaproteobacteria bacterium]